MALNIILNALLILIIAGGFTFGLKKGFISLAAGPIKFFLTLGIAFTACGAVAASTIAPAIEAPIASYVSDFLYKNCPDISAANVVEELPTMLKLAAGLAGLDIVEIANGADSAGTAIIEEISSILTAPVVDLFSVIIAFALVYIVAKIILTLIFYVINLGCKKGFVGGVNKLIGVVFGLCFSIIIAWGLVAVLELAFHSPAFADNALVADFEGGFLYGFFREYSPVELLLSF